jgi:hypothetical protein
MPDSRGPAAGKTSRHGTQAQHTGRPRGQPWLKISKPNGWIDFWINEARVRRGIPFSAGNISSHFGNAYSVMPGTSPCYRVSALTPEA